MTKSKTLDPRTLTHDNFRSVELVTVTREEGERWREQLKKFTKAEVIDVFLYLLELWNKDAARMTNEFQEALKKAVDATNKQTKRKAKAYLAVLAAQAAFAQSMSEEDQDSYVRWDVMRVQLESLHDCLESDF